MAEKNEPNNRFYYYRHQLDQNQLSNAVFTVTTKIYINRLIKLQTISTLILFSAIALQAIAIGTNDWYVLNVNEYVQTSKGGLWYYCYLANAGMVGKLDCYLYEKLPNFFVFANDRLFDSRVLLICSSGFLFIIILIEISGLICLYLSEKRGCDPFARLLNQRSRKFQILNNEDMKQPIQTSTPTLKAFKNNEFTKQQENFDLNDDIELDENFNRFQQYVENTNQKKKKIKPLGYFAFLAISLLTMVGTLMEFVLQVSGFALFDSYINKLLSLNRVFMAYRSWSYWIMAASILFILIFWIFKVISTRYVVNLTKKVVKYDPAFSAIGLSAVNKNDSFDYNSHKHKKSVIPQTDEKIFSIYNTNYDFEDVENEIPMKKQYPPAVKFNHKKSRQYANGLILNQRAQPIYQPKLPYSFDNNEEYEENDSIGMSESIMEEIITNNNKNNRRLVHYPSFPYIYRF